MGIALTGLSVRPSAAQVDWEIDPDAVPPWVTQGLQTLDGFMDSLQTNLTVQVADAVQGHMDELLAAADAAMQQASPEDMAELQPYLRAAAAHAKGIRGLAPYAAWLDARLDYFDAARAAVAISPTPPPVTVRPPDRPPVKPKPRPPAPTPPPSRPAVRPPRPAPPVELERKRDEAATSRPQWRKRVATHAKPVRADDMVPALKRAFRAEGVPAELVWIAEVESTMNPEARSPRGAVGLYQITPATARALGLSLSPDDERKDPARSASAAARYLRRLYDRFGSWPLALAAYNAGEGRISGLLKKRKASSFEGIASALPMETRMYVPRVLETVRLREGIDPDRLPPPG
jgi:membrane-bound lytic murein transglycosylase D